MQKIFEVAMKEKKYVPLVKNNKRKKKIESNNEVQIVKKANNKFIKLFVVISIFIMSLIVLGAIIDIFNFFYKLHPHAGYVSLVVILLLMVILVIKPIVVALATPCFTLDVIGQKSNKSINRKNYRKLKKVASNLIKGKDISDQAKKEIVNNIDDRNNLNKILRDVYDREISKKINSIINESATKTLVATAISQNNKIDSATVILVNIRMIMRIVVICGYHPTYPQLYKLIAKVFRNALIAYTLQSSNIDELVLDGVNKLVKGTLTSIPFISEVAKSLTQGAANALLTLRVGIITRKFLYEEFDIQAMLDDPEEENQVILEDAVKEANSSINVIIDQFKKSRKKDKEYV